MAVIDSRAWCCCLSCAGMGACVSLNIMWLHAEQASFKMTPAQYQDKLDSVAQLVNVLGQTDKVGWLVQGSTAQRVPHSRACGQHSPCRRGRA
jgi:cytochrome c-type biogenesis protein CcmE